MERYWDCSLCRIQEKARALRCRNCSGKLKGRERLLHEIAALRRVRGRAARLSALAPGLGQIYTGRWATGITLGILIPLALGLVWAVWNGPNYGHLFLAGSALFVLAVAVADAWLGPSEKKPPCQKACPAGVPIPDYLQLLLDDDVEQGYALIRVYAPLVGVIGRVCPHPCEARCVRGIDGEPVAINGCKRFLADRHRERSRSAAAGVGGRMVRLDGADLKVAVVGSGPAGLACAYYLSVLGVSVTVYEAGPVIGGRLATTIPDYRLPPHVLEEELEDLRARGVVFVTDTPVGAGGVGIGELLAEYSAVFLGIGASRIVPLAVPGADLCTDFQAFLEGAKRGGHPSPGRRVMVVGGGNAAMDVCRTALRLGAEEVHLVYRRSRDEMPARPAEVEEARREGVRFHFLSDPVEVARADGALRVVLQTMRLGPPDASGRPRPVPVEGAFREMTVDRVIPALGQRVDSPVFGDPALAGLEREPDGRIRVDPATQRTSVQRVYAGGDAVAGPSTAVEAMAHGRRAALGIFGDLAPQRVPLMRLRDRRLRPPHPRHHETPEARIREEMPALAVRQRKGNFREVELGFRGPSARREAGRCLQCHREL